MQYEVETKTVLASDILKEFLKHRKVTVDAYTWVGGENRRRLAKPRKDDYRYDAYVVNNLGNPYVHVTELLDGEETEYDFDYDSFVEWLTNLGDEVWVEADAEEDVVTLSDETRYQEEMPYYWE